jgi:cytochrome c-type biogenesis protein CcmH
MFLLRPLAAARSTAGPRSAFDAAVYRSQLDELARDRERGSIGEVEAKAAEIEIVRRLLATEEGPSRATQPAAAGFTRSVMIGIAVGLPVLALGLYLAYGSPRLPDQPLAARLQSSANEKNLAALIARVEARLRTHPEEGHGWDVIAPVYIASHRYADAADAYRQAIRLLGESPKRLSGYGEAVVLSNDGVVSEDARRNLERALALDANLLEPRILLAIAKEQDGKFAEAVADWRALLAKASTDTPWRKMVEGRIAMDEAHLAGKPVAGAEPQASAQGMTAQQSGPNEGKIAPADNMSPAERQAMIEKMVQGLAARLDQNGNDLAGWLKLVGAYSVLNRNDDAAKALAKAKAQFSGNADALRELDALAAELGLKS